MAINITDIVAQMRANLAASEPDLDTSVGSVTRKVLDAVAEVVAEAQADRHLLTYTYDVDTKQGADLDAFTSLFGIQRFPAQRSSGTVTFARSTPADSDISIPIGTRVSTTGSPEQRFSTAVPSVLREGQTEVEVPVVAVDPGALGNVAIGAITRRLTPLGSIPTVYNNTATTGGRDAEVDQSLRARFRQTVFRSMAGTEPMYRGVALDNPDVRRANVIGTSKTLRLSIEVASGTSAFTITDAKYAYENSTVLGPDLDAGDVYVEEVNYTLVFTPNGADIDVTVTEVGDALPDGIYEVEVDYIPNASRNDPVSGIVNRVDIYCEGTTARAATETLWFRQGTKFVNDANSPYHYLNFERLDGSNPTVGSYFVRYHFTPLVDGATGNILTLNTVNTTSAQFEEDTDFFVVRNTTPEGGAFRCLEGIEVPAAGDINDDPVDQVFTVEHSYNAVPRDVGAAIEQWRLLSTDVLVHAARPINLVLRLVVVYEDGTDVPAAEEDIFTAVAVEIDRVGFVNRLQTSDVLRAVAQVDGVDAVRFATSVDDVTEYAIQRLAEDGTTILTTYADGSGRAIDVVTDDDEVVQLSDITIDRRSRDSFATGQ